jgi:hypothetical protein
LDTLSSLGIKLYDIGDYEEARKVYEKCLLGKETVLGEDHKKTLATVNNLGTVFYDTGTMVFHGGDDSRNTNFLIESSSGFVFSSSWTGALRRLEPPSRYIRPRFQVNALALYQ